MRPTIQPFTQRENSAIGIGTPIVGTGVAGQRTMWTRIAGHMRAAESDQAIGILLLTAPICSGLRALNKCR